MTVSRIIAASCANSCLKVADVPKNKTRFLGWSWRPVCQWFGALVHGIHEILVSAPVLWSYVWGWGSRARVGWSPFLFIFINQGKARSGDLLIQRLKLSDTKILNCNKLMFLQLPASQILVLSNCCLLVRHHLSVDREGFFPEANFWSSAGD